MFKKLFLIMTVFVAAGVVSNPAFAVDEAKIKAIYEEKVKSWLLSPTVLDAIKAQNAKHTELAQSDIDELDKKWRAEDSAIVDPVLNNDLSTYLQGIVGEAEGFYGEIFVMDNKGLNVGQSAKTSDYWQGDEAKFQETYGKGDGAMHIGDVEFDESSQTYQFQLSVTISDNGAPVGAATIGIDAEAVE